MHTLRFAATKIQPPRTRSTRIARPALEARLGDALRTHRVVLLVAPAGFGKTTALAAQLARLAPHTAVAWVSLDEDDDSARLFGCIAAALEPFDLPWRHAPEALAGQLDDADANVRPVVDELVNALAAGEVEHGVIVLDDLHRVQSPQVHLLLDALIERLPPQWTLVIATRVVPRIALARWRAAGELAEITQAELRFSAEEARALAAAEHGEAQMARFPGLFERTQGWPAGLRLSLAALRARPGADGPPAAAGKALDRTLFDYLASEVLDEMPIELHDFLVRSAVLPVLTAATAAAVTGDARAAQRLDEIERRGLFVTTLDAPERTLVLHDLFRDALEERLRRTFPGELPQLLRRAAAVERDPLRRIACELRADDWAAAEATLAAAADDLLLEGLATEMRRLIAQFPPAWRERSARLLRLDAVAACMRWHWSEMARLLEAAVAAALGAGDHDELQLSRAMLVAAWNANERDVQSRALLGELAAQPLATHAALLVLDAQCTLDFQRGEFAAMPARFGAVIDQLETLDSLLAWWECSPPTAWVGLPGMRPVLERYCREALRRCGERELPMRATLHVLQAATHLWAGDIDAALADARVAEADARWLARAAEIRVGLDTLLALIDALRGRAADAQQRLESLFRHEDGQAGPERLRFWHGHVAQLAVRVHDVLGSDAATLRRWGAQRAQATPFDPPDPLPARLAAAEGRWSDAAEAFAALLPELPRLDRMGQGIELQLRAAHAQLRCGRCERAAPLLTATLTRVEREGEVGHALMAGPVVLAALADADWQGLLPTESRAALAEIAARSARLRVAAAPVVVAAVAGMTAPLGVPAPSLSMTNPADEPLSGREREVLERIAAGDSNKLIARALAISPHTVKRHVANILDKLALESRGQAAAWWRAQSSDT